jgi:hypothetical protein
LEKGARPNTPATLLAVDKNDEVLPLTESGRSVLPDSERRQAFGLTSHGRVVQLDLAVLSSPGDKGVVVELDKQERLVNC